MYVHTLARRRSRALLALAVTAVTVGSLIVAPAAAAPRASAPSVVPAAPAVRSAPADPEGGTATLREQLEVQSKGFLDAQAALAQSQDRQKVLDAQLAQLEVDLAARTEALGEVVGEAYRAGRLAPMSALLSAGSPDGFLDRAAVLGSVAANEDRRLRDLLQTREQATRNRLAVATEIREQTKQVAQMASRKQRAENALKAAAVGGEATAGPSRGVGGANAAPARRGSDGKLPGESCGVDDPTTSGCITPRTLHAMNQAKGAGFTRFVSCFRSGGSGEHPKGRACDFAAQKNGFGGTATGGDRTYGNNLANYFVRNAGKLGVLYVIWFRQIWLPSSGWRAYNGGGDPSSEHTNHVHLSMV
jgi:hypothetical protein